jgi:ornithine decarboxylase
MVAESGVMVSTVIGTADRSGKKWLHLDVGANNGMMEAVQTSNALLYPVHDSRKSAEKEIFTLTGPTCDSQDTILFDVPISHDIKIGDKVYFEFAGAYTTAMTENFNGFPDPATYILDK